MFDEPIAQGDPADEAPEPSSEREPEHWTDPAQQPDNSRGGALRAGGIALEITEASLWFG